MPKILIVDDEWLTRLEIEKMGLGPNFAHLEEER